MDNISIPISNEVAEECANEYIGDLIGKYADSVLRMCYIYLKDYHLAEDVTQKTFIRVMKHYGKFRNESSEKTWIMQIAINLCKSQLKSRWNRRVNFDSIPETAYDADYDGTLDRREVFDKVTNLKPKYREVILLYYYQEMSISEIATVLKLRESAVKVRLFRAREQLKLNLKEDWINE